MADTGLYNSVYTPDVLSCLANLSNDEVFTPPEVANAMLDLLPQELFSNPDTTFLDPACKSGVFLREIAKRLIAGLEPQFPDLQDRLDHIFHKQIFGIAITELTSLLSRRSLYCSKYPNSTFSVSHFDDPQGNIRFKRINHVWRDGKCLYCGASASQYQRADELETHAYEWIHVQKPEELFGMKFDVIISNPPYHLSDGGSGPSAIPLYNVFVERAIKLNPRYLTMIIPARWYAGGKGLVDFRDQMLNDRRITQLVDYPKSRDCFPGVEVAGGICYFLWERDRTDDCVVTTMSEARSISRKRPLNEFPVFIRDNRGIGILYKVLQHHEKMVGNEMLARNPFGLATSVRGTDKQTDTSITLISSAGKGYIERNEIKKNISVIDEYKVITGRFNPDRGGVNNARDNKSNVINKVRIFSPKEVCTETYLILGHFKHKQFANNCASYFSTKFARYLIYIVLSSVNITRSVFNFVPVQDFSKPWTDEELYAKYGLTQEEIDFIESMIKPMD